MKRLMFLTIITLCGCVQNRFLYSNENGNNVYQAKCDWGDFSDCLIEANRVCPSGFDILMSSETPTGSFSNFDTNGRGNTFGNFSSYQSHTYGNSWNTYSRYLIYACKAVNLNEIKNK